MCDSVDWRLPGSLTRLNMSYEIREALLDYMKVTQPKAFTDIIWNMMGDKDFLRFFDALEGQTIRIPSRQNMARIVSNISIYCYVNDRGYSQETLEKASLIYKKKPGVISKIYTDIDDIITKSSITEGEDYAED